jgi:hypothetical protein
MSEFEVRDAVRKGRPVFMGIIGCPGAGKTVSSLELASGFQKVSGGDIGVIDADNDRSTLYTDRYKFKHIGLRAPFGADRYLKAVEAMVKAGVKNIIVDTMSPEHDGRGGVLQEQDRIVGELSKKWSCSREAANMAAWQEAKKPRNRFVEYVEQELGVNLLMCFKAKDKTRPADKGKGEKGIIHMGWMPIGGTEYWFQMIALAILYPNSEGVPTWDAKALGEEMVRKQPYYFQNILTTGRVLSAAMGEELARFTWAGGIGSNAEPSVSKAAAQLSKQLGEVADDVALAGLGAKIAELKPTLSAAELKLLRVAFEKAQERLDGVVP